MPDYKNPRPIDLEGVNEGKERKLSPKAIYAGDAPASSDEVSQPYILVTEDNIQLVADSKKVISISPDFGLNLQGTMSIAAMPDKVSFAGGYLCINPLVVSTVPSTTPTPIPWLVKTTPRLLQAKDDLKDSLSLLKDNSDITS